MIHNVMDTRGQAPPTVDPALRGYLVSRRQSLLTEVDHIERLLGYKDTERTSEIRKMAKR